LRPCWLGRGIDNRLGNRTQARAGALHVAGDHRSVARSYNVSQATISRLTA
jgi:hypothetical protein